LLTNVLYKTFAFLYIINLYIILLKTFDSRVWPQYWRLIDIKSFTNVIQAIACTLTGIEIALVGSRCTHVNIIDSILFLNLNKMINYPKIKYEVKSGIP
jgi:hypothetical protein